MSNNPLLAKIKLPGRIFQLPSRGIFYTNNELADNIKNGEIHIRPMSALDEIAIKNPDQLFSGQAIEELFKSCVDGVNKPNELLSKDVDAIMIFLRTVTYGTNYEFSAKHTCKDAKEHSYIADIEIIIQKMKMIDPTTIDQLYTVELPNGQIVKLCPIKYYQIIDLIKDTQNKEKLTSDELKQNLIKMLSSIILSVDDVTNPEHIKEWVKNLPALYANRLAQKANDINSWGPDMTWKINCKDCGEEYLINIPLNPVSFFIE